MISTLVALLFSAQEPEKLPALEKRVTIELEGTLAELLDALRKEAGANIQLGRTAAAEFDSEKKTDLRLRDVTGTNALRWITRLHGLTFIVKDGLAVVVPGRPGDGAPVLRTYPTRIVHREAPDEPGGRVDLPDPRDLGLQVTRGAKPVAEDGGEIAEEMIIDLIKMNIAPGTWEGNQSIERDAQGRLLVNAPPSVHPEVKWFLDALDSLAAPSITVAVTIADADDEDAARAPRTILPAELDPTLRRLRKKKTREQEVTGSDTQRVHALTRLESSAPAAWFKGDVVLKSRISDAALLDTRACLTAGGRAVQVELRLSVGQSRDLDPVRTPPGLLPIQERRVTRLATTLLVPNGGGVLFSLPSAPRPQVCLLRAFAAKTDPDQPRKPLFAPGPAPDTSGVAEKLEKAPPAPLELDRAPLADFAQWLRKSAGVNVILSPDAPDERITIRAKAIAPAQALPLVLKGIRCGYVARDEAILIRPAGGEPLRFALVDARDAGYAPSTFERGKEEDASAFTPEDLCNLIKNTLHRDAWEEADGKTIMTWRGFLFLRNREEILRECADFVDERRHSASKRVALRAETLLLPAEAVEAATGNKAAQSFLVDAAQRDRLLAAGAQVERLGWISFENQQTFLEWDRARDLLHESGADHATLRAVTTASHLEVRPTLLKDGRTFGVNVSYRDPLVLEVREEKTRDGAVHVPTTSEVAIKTRVEIPDGETALFRFTADGRCRLLLLTPTLIP